MMENTGSETGGLVIIAPEGERLDAVNALQFKSSLIDLIQTGERRLGLDLSRVDFMDSSGLAVLVSSLRTMGQGGEIVLIAPSPKVEKLLVITKLNRVFRVFASREEAQSSI